MAAILPCGHVAGLRSSDRRQLLGVGLGRGEQVAALGHALDDRPDRPAVGPQVRVVQLVPGDRRRDRGARRGPDRVRRDERLDARRSACSRAGRGPCGRPSPTPTRRGPARSSRRPARRARPRRSSRRSCSLGHDRDPDLDAALAGRLRVAAHAEMPERGPVQPGQDEGLLPGRLLARVDVDVGERRLPRLGQAPGPGVDLEARLVAEPAQRRRAVGDAGGRWRRGPRGRRRRSRASGSATSARSSGMSFCQKPGRAGAVREALQVERPVVRGAAASSGRSARSSG